MLTPKNTAALIGSLLLAAGVHADPPPNDSCASAPAVDVGEQQFWTYEATFEGHASSCGIHSKADVWYSFTPSTSGTGYFNLYNCYMESGGSVQLSLRDGCSGAELGCISNGCNDVLAVPVTSGVTYLIRIATVDSVNSSGVPVVRPGDGNLVISVGTPPANDTCATAHAIVGAGSHTQNVGTAGLEGPQTTCSAMAGAVGDVWYAYTAQSTGLALVRHTNNNTFYSRMSVTDTCGGTPTDCPVTAGETPLVLNVTAGQTYYFRIEAELRSASQDITFQVEEIQPLPNDTCASPQTVGLGLHAWDTTNATTQFSTTECMDVHSDIFYRFVAPADGAYEISTVDSGQAPVITVFNVGCTVVDSCGANGSGVESGARVTRFMESGEEIVFSISAPYYNPGALSGQFSILDSVTPANDTCAGVAPLTLGTNTFNTTGALFDVSTACGGTYDVFFAFTAQQPGQYTFDTCGSYFDTILSIANTCGGTETDCNDNYINHAECPVLVGYPSRLEATLAANQTVYLRVSGWGQGQNRGHGALNVTRLTTTCPADFNGDNTRDVADLFAYINAWLAKTPSADFNNSSNVDVADLFAYINAWLAGC